MYPIAVIFAIIVYMFFMFLTARQPEKEWHHRSCIIYFRLHPQLSKNCCKDTSKVFSISVSTLGTWLEKITHISVWLPLVKHLTI